ncbi:MAG: hypothetical protein GYA30_07990 [Chloroflexi bacterium]|nr:hypothetical protein [Chloroflexota bacterium]OQA95082.1 MAG: hypothetical protein BWY25_02554 [Chloroflexi bacterium ADurb.Bin222]HOC22061.1 hypothetical protein [Anaerolineae bacterium]HQM14990.1 hypothetical protein [Anaerolineae bacterium]HUM36955.1 hypothetical protein [Anaerolineae bacterium]
MASRIKAVNAYAPKIKLGKRVEMGDLVAFIARGTGLNESGVRQVLLELRDAVLFFTLQGQPVKLEGLGTYTPTIDLAGELGIGHRADIALKNGLNVPGKFRGEIIHHENLGKTSDELVALWNAEHPEDPVS